MKIDRLKTILQPAKEPVSKRLERNLGGLSTLAKNVGELFLDERKPRVTVSGNTAHVAFVGVDSERLDDFFDLVSKRAALRGDLEALHLNPYTKRVVFRSQRALPADDELLEMVRSAEQEVGAALWDEPSDLDRVFPDEPSLILETAVEALADATAAFSGFLLKLLPGVSKIPESIGQNMYAALFITANLPPLRKALDKKLGKRRAEFFLHLGNAAALGLSKRPLASTVSLVDRLETLRGQRSRATLWRELKSEWIEDDSLVFPTALQKRRPVPLKKGPIERYEDRAKAVAAGAFAFSLITTRNPFRAVPAAFAAMPYPARYGRDLFAIETGRIFAGRGMLVLCPDALKRLDRVDCLVIPSETISRDQFRIDDVPALIGIERAEALAMAKTLFHSDHPLRVQEEGPWSLGPISQVAPHIPPTLLSTVAECEKQGAFLLGLSKEKQLLAVLEVRISEEGSAAEAVRKAAKMGMKLYVATDDPDFSMMHFSRKIDGIVRLSSGLGDEIRNLQEQGRTVCLVGSAPEEGFFASDVGVSVRRRGDKPVFGAHIVSPDIPRVIDTMLDACQAARLVSKQSATLALASASMGALASTSGRSQAASSRVVAVMSAASLLSMFNGMRRSQYIQKQHVRMLNPTPWHALTPDGVLSRLNALPSGKAPSAAFSTDKKFDFSTVEGLSRAVGQEMSNPLTPLLALGAGVSALVGSKADAGIVAGVGLINGIIGGVQRFRAERRISSLIKTAENKVRVEVDGVSEIRPAATLKVGDIVLLSRGDVVPSDCRILFSDSLEVDTSTLTGESLPVHKNALPSFAENIADITSMVFEGNHIAGGNARAVVTAVGEDTIMARASALSVIDEERGGVEARLRELMNLTGPITLAAGAALIGAGMLRGRRIEDLVSTAVGLAVAAVPEGLPLLATVAQLAAAERLSLRGALVKNPKAVEALGRVDILCMDKTGTLTEGRIALASVFDGEMLMPVEELTERGQKVLLAAVRSAAEEDRTAALDPLNAAVLRAKDRYLIPETAETGSRISMLPFDSARGYEAVIMERPLGASMFVKGTPELLMAEADAVDVGQKIHFADEVKKQFEDAISTLTGEGLRVIAVGVKEIADNDLKSESLRDLMGKTEHLTLLGLLAFRDPVRVGARDTIGRLARAGVRTVMITGDHPNTAEVVARETGLSGRGRSLSGTRIQEMSDDELEAAVEDVIVFARVTPAQKVRIVRAFERRKHIVGMVGDGANDAAAMRAADAGIAVGLDCTEAARAAADIVLKEAHIDELFEAVVEGRAMWRSVRNAVSVLVGGNLGEIAFTVAVGALAGRPPLSPRQLLVVNFLTDIAPSTAIALRPPSVFDLHALREAGPEAALGSLLNREIAARAVCTSMGAWTAWSMARVTGSRTRASTVALLGLVGSQLGQTLLSGGKNRSVVWTGLGSAALLGIMVQTPGLSRVLGCTPIGPLGWSIAVTASMGSTLLSPVVESVIQFAADRFGRAPASSLVKASLNKLIAVGKDLVEI
jgi:magnesium-transporting ATPase (P-type)